MGEWTNYFQWDPGNPGKWKVFSMFTDAEREDYIFHKLIRLAGKYGEKISADRFDEIVKTFDVVWFDSSKPVR